VRYRKVPVLHKSLPRERYRMVLRVRYKTVLRVHYRTVQALHRTLPRELRRMVLRGRYRKVLVHCKCLRAHLMGLRKSRRLRRMERERSRSALLVLCKSAPMVLSNEERVCVEAS
jgi:hypothetical protein